MNPKCIGIIGGAGPLAGASLLERVLRRASSQYGCYKDADFPKVYLLSYPFSEMLTPEMDVLQLRQELKECLSQLRKSGAEVLAIACNTLHAFLDENEKDPDLIPMPAAIAAAIPAGESPLVLCTSTSRRFGLHKRTFQCVYPDIFTQLEIDEIIDQILKGADQQKIEEKLLAILKTQENGTIILGCTELSLFSNRLGGAKKIIVDPLDLLAKEILDKSYSKTWGNYVVSF